MFRSGTSQSEPGVHLKGYHELRSVCASLPLHFYLYRHLVLACLYTPIFVGTFPRMNVFSIDCNVAKFRSTRLFPNLLQSRIKSKRKAAYSAARLEKLAYRRNADMVPPSLQDAPNAKWTMWHDNDFAYDNGICAECEGLVQLKYKRLRHKLFDNLTTLDIPGIGRNDSSVFVKRAEAEIQVIETRVDKLDRKHFDSKCLTESTMSCLVGAEPVPCEKAIAHRKYIPTSFKVGVGLKRKLNDFEPFGLEPCSVMYRFRLTLWIAEPANDEAMTVYHTCVRSKNDVWQ